MKKTVFYKVVMVNYQKDWVGGRLDISILPFQQSEYLKSICKYFFSFKEVVRGPSVFGKSELVFELPKTGN